VVIQNFRPGVAQRLRLDYETLCALNPRIVYASFTGYGEDGPIASKPGFDQVLQCMTGVAKAQGYPGDAPQVVWGSVLDFYGASMLAMGISGALFNREKTGQPQMVEASLLASSMALQAGRMVWADNEERDVERDLRGGGLSAIHPAREGHIYVQAQTQPFWEALCELTGLSHLARDPRYDDMRKRKTHEDELVPQLRQALMARTALEWEALFGSRVPCAAVRAGVDMFDHPQVAAQGLVSTHDHPTLGRYRAMGNPVTINGRAGRVPDRRAPMLGEHTQQVLADLGLNPDAIAALRAQGAVN
jgi:formyl-CoA transferase